MASGRLSFSIALNLATNQFKQGAEQVKNALRNIQYQVLGMASALGLGGIGLSNLVSRFVDVARETNRARMALRNISGEASTFGKNMTYLTDLAAQYGQDLNTLTTNFARFSAASNAAGVGLQEQYKIYSAVTKSVTAFGLSGEEANLTFMALGQMMSKGKISSEELRRQMGERIPIAMQAMASAAGVSIQQLDKMLKNGEIYSKDILPKFADELNKLTGSINVDNIETSVNRLRTAFIKLTEDLKIGEFYKKIVDGATRMLSTLQKSFMTFAITIANGIIGGKIFNAFVALRNSVLADNAKILANKIKAEEQATIATANRVVAEKKFNEISVLYSKASDEEKLKYYTQYKNAERAQDQMRLRETAAIKAKEVAVNANAALTTQTVWGAAWAKVGLAIKGAATAAWGLAKAFAPMAILAGLGYIVGKLIEARNAAKELAKQYTDYTLAVKNAGNDNSELIKIRAIVSALNDKKTKQEKIKGLQQELMGILDVEKWNRDDINAKLVTKIKLLKDAARAEVYANTVANTEKQIGDIAAGAGMDSETAQKYVSYFVRNGKNKELLERKIVADYIGAGKAISDGLAHSLSKAIISISKVNPLLNRANKDLKGAVSSGITTITTPINTDGTTPTGGGIKPTQSELDAAAEEAARKALDALAGAMKPELLPMDLSDSFTEGLEGYKMQVPVQAERDTTFDYKKTELEKLQEQYDIVKDHLNDLKEIAPQAIAEIANKEKELTTLSEALKVTELKEDLENLNKNIFSESIDGITGFANSIDSIANSWERVANADMSGWDRMIAIINALGDSVKGLTGAWEAYKTIKELIDTKEKASAALSLINSGKVIAASGSEATADLVAGTAKTFKANAAIPVIGAGIAIAGIAGILALIASLPKFEKGGIIGGSSYSGDKILGRFNSGERVLTKPDQAYLTKVLKGGATGGGSVEFKIKGKELVGILSQEQTRARR